MTEEPTTWWHLRPGTPVMIYDKQSTFNGKTAEFVGTRHTFYGVKNAHGNIGVDHIEPIVDLKLDHYIPRRLHG